MADGQRAGAGFIRRPQRPGRSDLLADVIHHIDESDAGLLRPIQIGRVNAFTGDQGQGVVSEGQPERVGRPYGPVNVVVVQAAGDFRRNPDRLGIGRPAATDDDIGI